MMSGAGDRNMQTKLRIGNGVLVLTVCTALALAQTTEPPATPTSAAPAATTPPANSAAAPTDAPAKAPDTATADKPSGPFEGEVTGDSVYVRSGAGVNWYPTMKLARGTTVRVIGTMSGWHRIVPPPGSFSYVESTAVERTAGSDKGVTKVDGVYVKAGSDLSPRKSAAQQILPKGTEVSIVGESEGFLKIAPPEGSYLYISEQYIHPVGPDGPKFKPTKTAEAPAAAKTTEPPAKQSSVVQSSTIDSPTETKTANAGESTMSDSGNTMISVEGPKTGSGAGGKYRKMLEAVESELRGMQASNKPAMAFTNLVDRYKPIADQDEDRVAQAVAKKRIEQLQARADLERLVNDAKNQNQSLEAFVAKLGDDRQRILDAKVPSEQRFWDLKGELQRSMAFGGMPNRYRLYDPLTSKTVAYIDIPPATGLDAATYLNQYVGIRVSSQYFSTAAKVTIGVANEISRLPLPGVGGATASAAPITPIEPMQKKTAAPLPPPAANTVPPKSTPVSSDSGDTGSSDSGVTIENVNPGRGD